MTDQEIITRFEELEAGRILGDLDSAEMDEWEQLVRDPRCQTDFDLELTAAAIEAEFQTDKEVELPPGLLAGLEEGKVDFIVPEDDTSGETIVNPPFWRKILADKETAWAAAAVFLILFIAQKISDQGSPPTPAPEVAEVAEPSPEEARAKLMETAQDLLSSQFKGIEAYQGMTGDVIWSDELQEGYMKLASLPANDPAINQYQLWIVDPSRDEEPVDGGVFDVPAGQDSAIIPIRTPLLVSKPQAFLITLEKPGGVVVSQKEVKVALADPAQT